MDKKISYNYHVFAIVQDDGREKKYVAEGPSSIVDLPVVLQRLENLANEIYCDHLEYLGNELDKRFLFDGKINYIGFSFASTCDNVIHRDEIYRTQRLSKNEQRFFLQHMKHAIG